MSPTINKGTIRPVDSLAPKASAIRVTIIIPIPFIPAFEIPRITEAIKAIIQVARVISKFLIKWGVVIKAKRQMYPKK